MLLQTACWQKQHMNVGQTPSAAITMLTGHGMQAACRVCKAAVDRFAQALSVLVLYRHTFCITWFDCWQNDLLVITGLRRKRYWRDSRWCHPRIGCRATERQDQPFWLQSQDCWGLRYITKMVCVMVVHFRVTLPYMLHLCTVHRVSSCPGRHVQFWQFIAENFQLT